MTRLRLSVGLPLALLVAFASVVMATGRGRTDTALTVAICSGTTVIIVSVGPDGTPVEKREICPDYGLALFCGVAADAPCAAPVQVRLVMAYLPLVSVTGRDGLKRTVRVRGPPLA